MKKLFLIILMVVLVTLLILSGCAKQAPSPTSSQTKPAPAVPSPTVASPAASPASLTLPKSVVVGTNAPGTLTYTFTIALGDIIMKYTPMKVEQFPAGHTVWWPMIDTGELQFGCAASEAVYAAYLGKYEMEAPTKGLGFDLRTLMHGYDLPLAFYVTADSPIKTMKDLKGKKVPVEHGAQFTGTLTALALLANAGLTKSDVVAMAAPNTQEGVRAVIEGRADAAATAVGMAITEELKAAKGARCLPVDTSPEAIARMKAIYPGYFAMMVEPGLAGITEKMYVLGKVMELVSHKHLSDDAAYAITKAISEHYQDTWPIHATFKGFTLDKFVSKDAVAPYHPGAIKYYKEKNIWTPEMEKYNNELLALKK